MPESYRQEHVVECVWVYPGGGRRVLETRVDSLPDAVEHAAYLRDNYSKPSPSGYVESAVARTDLIPPDNSPGLDVVLDAALYNEVYGEE